MKKIRAQVRTYKRKSDLKRARTMLAKYGWNQFRDDGLTLSYMKVTAEMMTGGHRSHATAAHLHVPTSTPESRAIVAKERYEKAKARCAEASEIYRNPKGKTKAQIDWAWTVLKRDGKIVDQYEGVE